MSKRSAKLLLEDITDAISNILEYTQNYSFEKFMADKKTKDAVVRNFEIVGEAANKLPKQIYDDNLSVDWSGLIGLRHKLIHDYFGVDYKIVWYIIHHELETLKNQIDLILEK